MTIFLTQRRSEGVKKYTSYDELVAEGIVKAQTTQNIPPCIAIMEPTFLEYNPGVSISYQYPVLEKFLNPQKTMQGGFLTAAFDNVMGTLAYLEAKSPQMSTLDLSVNFHRPALADDVLTITAFLKHKGKTVVSLTGEACNSQGKLVATATTNLIIK
jgi:uncharacterized protein (TIGR00369 family)